jgi:hypothetical protein
MEESPLVIDQLRHIRGDLLGWDRAAKKLLPTLTRKNASEAWGFSCVGGVEIMENGGRMAGIVTSRHERGLWLKVKFLPDLIDGELFLLFQTR